jgi:hypothetical protein
MMPDYLEEADILEVLLRHDKKDTTDGERLAGGGFNQVR